MEHLRRHLFVVIWILAGAFAAYLYFGHYVSWEFIGLVEKRTHPAGPLEEGRLSKILVKTGESVKAGQVLAWLDTSDLEAERGSLNRMIDRLDQLAEAEKERYQFEFTNLSERMRLDYDALTLQHERLKSEFEIERQRAKSDLVSIARIKAELAAKKAEASVLASELERWRKAESAGLGSNPIISELAARKAAADEYVKSLEASLAVLEPPPAEGESAEGDKVPEIAELPESSPPDMGDPENGSILDAIAGDRQFRAAEARHLLAQVEARIQARAVVSPCDGIVTWLWVRLGDNVAALGPVFSIEETQPVYADVYLPESSTFDPLIGSPVRVFSKRDSAFDTEGTVDFIYPAYEVIPERLTFRGQIAWARKVRLKLKEGHQLLPGESIRARFLASKKTAEAEGASAAESAPQAPVAEAALKAAPGTIAEGALKDAPGTVAEGAQKDAPGTVEKDVPSQLVVSDPKPMTLPDSLKARSRFEPSGAVWLDDLKQFLVVSDDTGLPDDKDHAPWVFLMDMEGRVDPEPLVIEGLDEVSDLESASCNDEGLCFFLASQSLSKNGKRPDQRQYLLEVKRDGRQLKLERKTALFSLIRQSFSDEKLARLGLTVRNEEGDYLLDIEASAFLFGDLYLGLKEPVSPQGAIIWRILDLEKALKRGVINPEEMEVYAKVPLFSHKGLLAGFSDFAFMKDGRMVALSTFPTASDEDQIGVLYLVDKEKAAPVHFFNNRKPEGIALFSPHRAMILFDAGEKNPEFSIAEIPAK